jgi:antibiotic biosynthesis monooxygenase (ABM) superfamily enzyme
MYPHVRQLKSRPLELERDREPRIARRRRTGSQRYKLALLTWASAYGVITLMLTLLGPLMASWPLALRTLVLSATMVATLTWVVMPRLTRLFQPWLAPRG